LPKVTERVCGDRRQIDGAAGRRRRLSRAREREQIVRKLSEGDRMLNVLPLSSRDRIRVLSDRI